MQHLAVETMPRLQVNKPSQARSHKEASSAAYDFCSGSVGRGQGHSQGAARGNVGSKVAKKCEAVAIPHGVGEPDFHVNCLFDPTSDPNPNPNPNPTTVVRHEPVLKHKKISRRLNTKGGNFPTVHTKQNTLLHLK